MKLYIVTFLFFSIISCFSYNYTQNIDYIRSIEHEALQLIKEAYNIESAQWQEFLQKITDVRNQAKELFSKANPEINHDQNIPQEKLQIIYGILKEHNINPQSVHIVIMRNEILELAQAGITLMTRLNYHLVENPKIMISEKLLSKKNIEEFKAIIYHELGHLLELHGAIKVLVEKLVQNKEIGVAQKNALDNLQRVQEFIADQYCASKNSAVLPLLEKYLKPEKNVRFLVHASKPWYPTLKERFESFLLMKNTLYGNHINRQIL